MRPSSLHVHVELADPAAAVLSIAALFDAPIANAEWDVSQLPAARARDLWVTSHGRAVAVHRVAVAPTSTGGQPAARIVVVLPVPTTEKAETSKGCRCVELHMLVQCRPSADGAVDSAEFFVPPGLLPECALDESRVAVSVSMSPDSTFDVAISPAQGWSTVLDPESSRRAGAVDSGLERAFEAVRTAVANGFAVQLRPPRQRGVGARRQKGFTWRTMVLACLAVCVGTAAQLWLWAPATVERGQRERSHVRGAVADSLAVNDDDDAGHAGVRE